ncbi:hypothetical protein Drorol1_Dr00019336 [Drosera rotundifolia]
MVEDHGSTDDDDDATIIGKQTTTTQITRDKEAGRRRRMKGNKTQDETTQRERPNEVSGLIEPVGLDAGLLVGRHLGLCPAVGGVREPQVAVSMADGGERRRRRTVIDGGGCGGASLTFRRRARARLGCVRLVVAGVCSSRNGDGVRQWVEEAL